MILILEGQRLIETFLKSQRPDRPVLDEMYIKTNPGAEGYMLLLILFARMFCKLLQPNVEPKPGTHIPLQHHLRKLYR